MKSKIISLGVFYLVVIQVCSGENDVSPLDLTSENEVVETTNTNIIDHELTTLGTSSDPCSSSPCGPHAKCTATDDNYECECLPSFINKPPNCRPECLTNDHCLTNMTCVNHNCVDACLDDICGINTNCKVQNHTIICECRENYSGNAFVECTLKESEYSPCSPNPCGDNAVCREKGGIGSCQCLPNYYENPEKGCMPQCSSHTDCPSNAMCLEGMCFNPCPDICPENADCLMEDHVPFCFCKDGYTGNAYDNCTKIEVQNDEGIDPCLNGITIFGENSQCKDVNGIAACSCLPGFNGSPPECTSGCVSAAGCPADKTCVNHACVDPCTSKKACGKNTNCTVVNHSPVCSCLEGFSGDPLDDCHQLLQPPFSHPCVISPCGPNSKCRLGDNGFTCHCLPGYVDDPPNCKPECTSNENCSANTTCIDKRCKDPCDADDICGENATCHVKNHVPNCQCPDNYSGDPFVVCSLDVIRKVEDLNSSEKGDETVARVPKATKPTEITTTTETNSSEDAENSEETTTFMIPIDAECKQSPDCPEDKACVDFKCQNPCNDACGIEAECKPIGHFPICICNAGYTGDPYTQCWEIPERDRNASVVFIAWHRSENSIFTVWKPTNTDDSEFTMYRVSIEPPDATEDVQFVKGTVDPKKILEASFEGLVPGRLYNISVQTKSTDTLSAPTIAEYRTLPLKPVNVTVDLDATTPSKFRINWEAPDNKTEFDGYEVTIHSDSEFFDLYQEYVSKAGDFEYSFGMRKNVEPGQTYQVTVKTVSANVTSWPETINVTTKPLPVENLHPFIDTAVGHVTVLWEPHMVSVQNEYKISYIAEQNQNATPFSVKTNQTYLVLDSLQPQKNYLISVRAISNGIESDEATINVYIPPIE